MKNVKLFVFVFISICILKLELHAQTAKKDSVFNMSLKQAQDYALQNSPTLKNATLDLEIAKKKIWETTAIGLPQISGKLSYSYMLTLSSTIEQFSSLSSIGGNFGTIYGMFGAANAQLNNPYITHILDSLSSLPSSGSSSASTTNDMRWGLTLDITASQILFSGAYLVGLQTSKVFRSLSEIGVTKSTLDLKQNVASAYYLVLIAGENVRTLDSNYQNTLRLLDEISAINKQGFVEETDVDQLKIAANTLKDALNLLKRQEEIAKNLLKFQMGMEISSNIQLTQNLNEFVEIDKLASSVLQKFDTKTQPDMMLLESQEKLMGLNVKLNKSSYLPDVYAFFTHQENFNNKSFSFTPPNMVGVGMNIPIFSSGSRNVKLKQAKLQLTKTQNSKYQVEQGLILDYEQSKSACINAMEKVKTQKESMDLSKKIYNRTVIKYKEGVSSSMELAQANTQYLTNQSNYFMAVMELLNSKAKLDKILNIN
jgi:outer membrane protein TolC